MEKFARLSGIAAPLPLANVDTDKIIPARFLKTIRRTGLGQQLFADLRYDAAGAERPDFVLNQPPYRSARILIALENFGCGSSREHAVWALADFGIRAVIAPCFADIFYSNCFKNGILPLCLPRPICEVLMADCRFGANAALTIDLERERVIRPSGKEIAFSVDPFRRQLLLEGRNEIGQTLALEAKIAAYEARARAAQPWLPAIDTI